MSVTKFDLIYVLQVIMPSVGDSSDDKTNAFTLYRLIVDLGTKALRITFNRYNPGNLQAVLSTHNHTLLRLKHKNIVTQSQWDGLYPATPNPPNINDFDITLLSLLLRNICGLKPPSDPIWVNKPNTSDHSTEADVTCTDTLPEKSFFISTYPPLLVSTI